LPPRPGRRARPAPTVRCWPAAATGSRLGGAGAGVPLDPILAEDACLAERLDQGQHAPVPDSPPQPHHERAVVDLIKAGRDVAFQHPLIPMGCQQVDLGDGVLRPAARAEPVRARVEVRLEDRLQHQLERGLDHPVPDGRDPQAALLAAGLGDQPLPHRQRHKPPGLQVGPELGEERLLAPHGRDVVGRLAIYPGRAGALVALDPAPPTSSNAGSQTRL
jgi:hypothetical protein